MANLQAAAKNVISAARFIGFNGKEFTVPFESVDMSVMVPAIQKLVAACDGVALDATSAQWLNSARFWLSQKEVEITIVSDEEINNALKLVGFDLAGRLIKIYA